jgi:NAD(P)H-flavin reductase
VRNYDDICFKSELNQLADQVVFTLTETQPDNWQGHRGIITAEMLKPMVKPDQTIYVCGPTAYVEAVDHILVDQLGVNPLTIKTERFG